MGVVVIAALGAVVIAAWGGWRLRRAWEALSAFRRQKRAERLLRAYESVQRTRLLAGGTYRTNSRGLEVRMPSERTEALSKLQELHVEVVKHVCECSDCMSLLRGLRDGVNDAGPRRDDTTPGKRCHPLRQTLPVAK